MDGLKVIKLTLGILSTNCYLVFEKNSRKAVIIDPADEYERITAEIERLKLKPSYIILTHGHSDHIKEVDKFNLPCYIHYQDKDFLTNPDLNFSPFIFSKEIIINTKPSFLKDNDVLALEGSYQFRVIHTPGHTPGSISLKIGDFLFSGDALFNGSIGRTDIPYGDYNKLVDSIKKRLLIFDDKTYVFCGHGSDTTIGWERLNNPFLK